MIKVAILGYTALHGFYFACQSCMQDQRFWMPYWVADEMFGGGIVLWYIAYRYSKKYRIPAFMTFLFACFREAWNIICYIAGINTSNTKWTIVLFIGLILVIYWTLFVPNGRLTNWLMRTLNLKDDRLYAWQERIVRE